MQSIDRFLLYFTHSKSQALCGTFAALTLKFIPRCICCFSLPVCLPDAENRRAFETKCPAVPLIPYYPTTAAAKAERHEPRFRRTPSGPYSRTISKSAQILSAVLTHSDSR